jgi:eukaryotic-like serine/threonine-protein kinase
MISTAEGKWRISTAGGDQPRWRGDGKELLLVGADAKMTAVVVKAAPSSNGAAQPFFEAGAPVPLFEVHIPTTPGNTVYEYDVTSDGKRFLVTTTAAASAPFLAVVVNCNAGLKK